MTLIWNNALPWPLIALIGVLIVAALFFSYRKPRREMAASFRFRRSSQRASAS